MSYFQYGSAQQMSEGEVLPPVTVKKNRKSKAKESSQRKGSLIREATLSRLERSRIESLVQTNGPVKELRRYTNGSIGVFLDNGKFRFIAGGNNLSPRKKGSKMKFRQISKLSAQRALAKYYKNRSYKNDAARKAALTRDLCSTNKPVITDSRYLRKNGPANYDYPNVDDGSTCPPGHKIYRKKRITASRKKQLLQRLHKQSVTVPAVSANTPLATPSTTRSSQMGGGRVFTYADNAANRRLNRVGKSYVRSSRRNKRQIGGSKKGQTPSISLQKAVQLLRQYYKEKYNNIH